VQGNANMAGFLNWVLEYAPASDRPMYIGFANTLNGVTLIMPLLGGWILAASGSYPALFVVAAVGPLGVRTRFAREIVALHPALIRGNASEIIALAGQTGRGRGVDSGDAAEAALAAARALAGQTGGAVLVTGPVDYAIYGAKTIACANGHPLMTRVTGVGCAQGAVAAACAAVADNPLAAAAAAAVFMGVAGDLAARASTRPGTFSTALLDALDQLDADTLRRETRLS